jgi:hypothetical protein
MVRGTAERSGCGQDPGGLRQVVDGRNLPGQVVEPHRTAAGPWSGRAHGEQTEIVVVVTTGGPHEDGLAAHFGADHLEAEDPTVELGRLRGVANEQDGVVEAGDRNAHGPSVPRPRRDVDRHHAATGTVEGARRTAC